MKPCPVQWKPDQKNQRKTVEKLMMLNLKFYFNKNKVLFNFQKGERNEKVDVKGRIWMVCCSCTTR